jgi:hypothetical protein
LLLKTKKPGGGILPGFFILKNHLGTDKAELSSLPAQTKLMPFGYKEFEAKDKRLKV